jgi:hypothetical protein
MMMRCSVPEDLCGSLKDEETTECGWDPFDRVEGEPYPCKFAIFDSEDEKKKAIQEGEINPVITSWKGITLERPVK